MKKLDLGQITQTLANIGVIAGIIFLALEIRQNTASSEAQLRFSQSERMTEAFEELFRNDELGEAFLAYLEGRPLTELQDLKLAAYAQRIFVSWQWLYGEWRRTGTADFSLEFRRAFHTGPTMDHDNALYHDYWARINKVTFDPEFVVWMEEAVIAPGAP
ncbi:MAG TPA: hypothetical protein VIV14_00770 [Gammaproteobacteria bacterium]